MKTNAIRDAISKYTRGRERTAEVSPEIEKRAYAIIAFLKTMLGRTLASGIEANPEGVDEEEETPIPHVWAKFAVPVDLANLRDLQRHFQLEPEEIIVQASTDSPHGILIVVQLGDLYSRRRYPTAQG